jgi:hypothetical protein
MFAVLHPSTCLRYIVSSRILFHKVLCDYYLNYFNRLILIGASLDIQVTLRRTP